MGKRQVRSKISENLDSGGRENVERLRELEEGEKEGGGGVSSRFYACYLLTSLSPRHKGHTYIGFTVNPRRRIRQHNGEMRCGAWRTKNRRPWEMVLCIYGFPTNVAALQFEWAWQHPVESLAVRKAAATFKSLSGVANKIKLAYTMLTLPAWQSFNLTVNFFSTKYTNHSAGCPTLPEHMKVRICSMDELPCYTGCDWNMKENDEWAEDEECDETSGTQESIKESEDGAVHDFASSQNSSEECTQELERIEEIGMTRPRYQTMQEEEENHGQPFDSPVRVISSFATSSDTILEPVGAEEYSAELNLTTREQLASVPCEVEVIDLFTPSPGYRNNSGSKKRRVSTACPEVIDLTKSPIFV